MSRHHDLLTADAPFRRTQPVRDEILRVLGEMGNQAKYDIVLEMDWDPRTEFEEIDGYVYYKKRLREEAESAEAAKEEEEDEDASFEADSDSITTDDTNSEATPDDTSSEATTDTFDDTPSYMTFRYDRDLVLWTTALIRELCCKEYVYARELCKHEKPVLAVIHDGQTTIFATTRHKRTIAEVGEILAFIGACFTGAQLFPFLTCSGRRGCWTCMHISLAAAPFVERVEQDETAVAEQSVEMCEGISKLSIERDIDM